MCSRMRYWLVKKSLERRLESELMPERPLSSNPYRVPAENTVTQEVRDMQVRAELHRKAGEFNDFLEDPLKRPLPSDILRRLTQLKEEGFGLGVDSGDPVLFRFDAHSLYETVWLETLVGKVKFEEALRKLGFFEIKRPNYVLGRLEQSIKNYKLVMEQRTMKKSKAIREDIKKQLDTLLNRLQLDRAKIEEEWEDVRSRVATYAILEVPGTGESELVEERRKQAKDALDEYQEFRNNIVNDIENDFKLLKEV